MFSGITGGFAKFGLVVGGIKAAIQGIGAVISTPLELAANAEQTSVAFEVLLGNAEHAQAVLALKQAIFSR